MIKVLVIEDDEEIYHDHFLRFFSELLPMDQIEFVHAPTIERALKLIEKTWDVILMDYYLGASHLVAANTPEGVPARFRDGADLIRFRRTLEIENAPATFIIGVSNNQVANTLLVEAGADTAISKLNVVQVSDEIKRRLPRSE